MKLFVILSLFIGLFTLMNPTYANLPQTDQIQVTKEIFLKARNSNSSSMEIFWETMKKAKGYMLEYSLDSGASFTVIYSGSGTSYYHTGLQPDTTYYYRLSADLGKGMIIQTPVIGMRTEPVVLKFGGLPVKGYISNLSSYPFVMSKNYKGNLCVISPWASNFLVDNYFVIKGTNHVKDYSRLGISVQKLDSDTPVIWYYCDEPGYFKEKVFLRFGAGDYCVKVLNGPDNKGVWYTLLKMYVKNSGTNIFCYQMPTETVPSYNPYIRALAYDLVSNTTNPSNQAYIIHNFVGKYLCRDIESLSGNMNPMDAISVMERGSAVCTGYAVLYAALLRVLDIPVKIIFGKAKNGDSWPKTINHAWNEVYWDGAWHIVDVTWNDMFLNGLTDYPDGTNLRWKYFDISEKEFKKDHSDGTPFLKY